MLTSSQLKSIVTAARPIIERQLEDATKLAAMRDVVAKAGGDWGQLKALIKAQIRDENDDEGDGKYVRKILDKAEYATAYADMLGLSAFAKMNEKNFFEGDVPDHDPETGEVLDRTSVQKAHKIPGPDASAQSYGAAPRTPSGSADEGETEHMQDGSGPVEVHTLEQAGSTPAPATISAPVTQETADSDGSGATPALVATNSGQPSPDNDRSRGATSSLNSTPAPVDRSKPNPWCMDPDECGVEASWDYFCLKCQAVKKGREAAGAALQ